MVDIPPLRLQLKPYCKTGIFYIPKLLIEQKYLELNKRYRLTIEEVKENG